MGADPRPDSLENRPRAQPNWSAIIRPDPTAPPNAALGVKAHSKVQAERLTEQRPVEHEYDDAARSVGHSHERHELLAHLRDGLYAAEDDRRDEHHDNDADDPCGNVRIGRDDAGHGGGLHGRAGADSGDGGERGECHSAELRPPGGAPVRTGIARSLIVAPERAFPDVHGAAEHGSVVIAHAVLHGRVHLGVLCGDAEHAGEPASRAPRPGPPSDDGCGHAHDGTGADGGRKRRCEGAEVADVTFAFRVARQRQLDGAGQLALDEPRLEREEQMRPQQERDHGRTPDESVDCFKNFDHSGSPLYPKPAANGLNAAQTHNSEARSRNRPHSTGADQRAPHPEDAVCHRPMLQMLPYGCKMVTMRGDGFCFRARCDSSLAVNGRLRVQPHEPKVRDPATARGARLSRLTPVRSRDQRL